MKNVAKEQQIEMMQTAIETMEGIARVKLVEIANDIANYGPYSEIPTLPSKHKMMAELLYQIGFRKVQEEDGEVAISLAQMYDEAYDYGCRDTTKKVLGEFISLLVQRRIVKDGSVLYFELCKMKNEIIQEKCYANEEKKDGKEIDG